MKSIKLKDLAGACVLFAVACGGRPHWNAPSAPHDGYESKDIDPPNSHKTTASVPSTPLRETPRMARIGTSTIMRRRLQGDENRGTLDTSRPSRPDVDVFPVDSNATDVVSLVECPIVGFLPFTIYENPVRSFGLVQPQTTTWVFTHVAAAYLAADHFNMKDPAVVPELADFRDCPVQIPDIEFFNSDGDVYEVSRFMVDKLLAQDTSTCSILGPYFNAPAIEASHMANGLDIPMVTHGAEDLELTSEVFNPRVARTSVNFFVITRVIISFLQYWKRDNFLATIALFNHYGDQYREAMDNAAERANYTYHELIRFGPPWDGRDEPPTIHSGLQRIKRLGYRTIFLVLDDANDQRFQAIADFAEELGLNNGDYFWMVSGNIDLEQLMEHANRNANVTKLVTGMTVIRILDGFEFEEEGDAFLREWKKQDETLVERANAQYPEKLFQASPDYFQNNLPMVGAGFIYDAVMTIGMSKCKAEEKKRQQEQEGVGEPGEPEDDELTEEPTMKPTMEPTREPEQPLEKDNEGGESGGDGDGDGDGGERDDDKHGGNVGERGVERRTRGAGTSGVRGVAHIEHRRQLKAGKGASTKNPHFDAIKDLQFQGATGRVEFRDDAVRRPAARNRNTVVYGAFNIRPIQEKEKAINPNYTTWFYLTHTLRNTTTETDWQEVEGGAPIIFANGQTQPSELLRDLGEQNYLSMGVQITGLTFMSFALALILASTVLIFVYRTEGVFRRNQPIFLFLLMLGAGIFTLVIVTLSFDEGNGWSEEGLSAACMATPWLLSIGYCVMYLALFSKLFRVDKVLQFRKRKVKMGDVIKPFVVVMVCVLTVLVVWSVHDPLQWERIDIDISSNETYGKCLSSHGGAYAFTLVGLMALCTFACGYMAYKCRDIDTRFSEATWIFYTIFVQTQVLLVGTPILFILDDNSADATYLGRCLLIFVIAMTTVGLMIGPKAVIVLGCSNQKNEHDAAGRMHNGSGHRRGSTGTGVRISGLTYSQGTGVGTGSTFTRSNQSPDDSAVDPVSYAEDPKASHMSLSRIEDDEAEETSKSSACEDVNKTLRTSNRSLLSGRESGEASVMSSEPPPVTTSIAQQEEEKKAEQTRSPATAADAPTTEAEKEETQPVSPAAAAEAEVPTTEAPPSPSAEKPIAADMEESKVVADEDPDEDNASPSDDT